MLLRVICFKEYKNMKTASIFKKVLFSCMLLAFACRLDATRAQIVYDDEVPAIVEKRAGKKNPQIKKQPRREKAKNLKDSINRLDRFAKGSGNKKLQTAAQSVLNAASRVDNAEKANTLQKEDLAFALDQAALALSKLTLQPRSSCRFDHKHKRCDSSCSSDSSRHSGCKSSCSFSSISHHSGCKSSGSFSTKSHHSGCKSCCSFSSKSRHSRSHHSKSDSSCSSRSRSCSRGHAAHDCDECVYLIKDVKEQLVCCCKRVTHLLEDIKRFLEEHLCCKCQVIDSLPVVLSESGKYSFAEDLSFFGAGPAITVASNDVCIDLCCHSLTLGGGTQGIFAEGVSKVSVENGSIKSFTATNNSQSHGVLLLDVDGAQFEKLSFSNTFFGIRAGTETDQVSVRGVTNLKVHNCEFQNPAVDSAAIQLSNSAHWLVDSCAFLSLATDEGFRRGIFGKANVCNGIISRCQFMPQSNCKDIAYTAIQIQGVLIPFNECKKPSKNLLITECEFKNTFSDIVLYDLQGNSFDAIISHCTSSDSANPLNFIGGEICVEKYVANVCPTGFHAVRIEMFNGLEDKILNHNITFKDCIFNFESASIPESQPNDCILVQQVEGFAMDGCTIHFNQVTACDPWLSSAIHLGSGRLDNTHGTNANDVRITNCNVYGNAQYGILSETCEQEEFNRCVVIKNCQVDGFQESGIRFINTKRSAIKNCEVKNVTGTKHEQGHGISLASHTDKNPHAKSKCNAVIENTCAHCDGSGIHIEDHAKLNLIKANDCFCNKKHGIKNHDNSKTNQFYFNTACNNDHHNCSGFPDKLVAEPGHSHFALGQNICCNQ